ncbi:hypothetical protein BJF81_08490 [Ornithinimicrobium sp. CNJ-824]|nr:hypothetical protein BJF81_08490 [Ornithinimicrobium sp. CNJ-824]
MVTDLDLVEPPVPVHGFQTPADGASQRKDTVAAGPAVRLQHECCRKPGKVDLLGLGPHPEHRGDRDAVAGSQSVVAQLERQVTQRVPQVGVELAQVHLGPPQRQQLPIVRRPGELLLHLGGGGRGQPLDLLLLSRHLAFQSSDLAPKPVDPLLAAGQFLVASGDRGHLGEDAAAQAHGFLG